jgi:hypothetical protein
MGVWRQKSCGGLSEVFSNHLKSFGFIQLMPDAGDSSRPMTPGSGTGPDQGPQ